MIDIRIDEAEGRITITGHSGYEEPGKDIICAGVSALFYGFAEAEAQAGGLLEIKSEPGDCYAVYRRTKSARRRLEVFGAGAKMLALTYPGHVKMAWEISKKEF